MVTSLREIIYSSWVREYIGSKEDVVAKEDEVAQRNPEAYLRIWPLVFGQKDTDWVLQIWTAKAEEYEYAG